MGAKMPISDDARHRLRGRAVGRERFSGSKIFLKRSTLDRRQRVSRGEAWKRAVSRLPAPALTSIRFACQRAWETAQGDSPRRFPDGFKSHWERGDFWERVPGVIRRGDPFKGEAEWVVLTRNFDSDGGWDV